MQMLISFQVILTDKTINGLIVVKKPKTTYFRILDMRTAKQYFPL